MLRQHTEEILLKLGYTSQAIARLEAEGIVRTTRKNPEKESLE
jgi:DNA-binding MarR family transcriptional regulator